MLAAAFTNVGPRRDPRVLGATQSNVAYDYYNEFAPSSSPIQWTGDRGSCQAGTISAAYKDDVVERINYFRRLAGVPPTNRSADLDTKAQAAALIQSFLKTPTHEPAAGSVCHTAEGAAASNASNLSLTSGIQTIGNQFISDHGTPGVGIASDVNRGVGHRAFLLSPDLRTVGIGDVPGLPGDGGAMAIHVTANTFNVTAPQFQAWPPAGLVPDDLIYQRWSVQRRSTDFTRATVTVTTNGTNVPLMVVYPILPKDTEDRFGTSTFTWEIESDTLIAGNTYTVTIAGAVSGGVTVPRWSYDVTVFDTGAYEAAAVAQFGDVVDRMFADFLNRPPLTTERQMWSAQIKASRNRTLLAEELANSPEWTGAVIDRMYVDTLGRAGDSTGREYWISRLRTDATVRQVAASFYSSPEYFSRYGRGDSRTWIADLYVKVLGRAPDAVGLAYWETTLTRTNRHQVAAGLYQSVESRNARVTALYRSLLGRDPDPTGLAAWSERLVTSDDMTLAVELATSDEYGRRR